MRGQAFPLLTPINITVGSDGTITLASTSFFH